MAKIFGPCHSYFLIRILWEEVVVAVIGSWSVLLSHNELEFYACTCIDTTTYLVKFFSLKNHVAAKQFEQTWLAHCIECIGVICDNGQELILFAFGRRLHCSEKVSKVSQMILCPHHQNYSASLETHWSYGKCSDYSRDSDDFQFEIFLKTLPIFCSIILNCLITWINQIYPYKYLVNQQIILYSWSKKAFSRCRSIFKLINYLTMIWIFKRWFHILSFVSCLVVGLNSCNYLCGPFIVMLIKCPPFTVCQNVMSIFSWVFWNFWFSIAIEGR